MSQRLKFSESLSLNTHPGVSSVTAVADSGHIQGEDGSVQKRPRKRVKSGATAAEQGIHEAVNTGVRLSHAYEGFSSSALLGFGAGEFPAVRGCPMSCGMFSNIPDLYSLDARSTLHHP